MTKTEQTEGGGGLDRIRYAVKHLGEGRARLQQFCQINVDHLDQFAKGERDLDAKMIGKIVSFIFNDKLVYVAETDDLASASSVNDPQPLATVMAGPTPARGTEQYNAMAPDLPVLTGDPDDDAARRSRQTREAKTGTGWGR